MSASVSAEPDYQAFFRIFPGCFRAVRCDESSPQQGFAHVTDTRESAHETQAAPQPSAVARSRTHDAGDRQGGYSDRQAYWRSLVGRVLWLRRVALAGAAGAAIFLLFSVVPGSGHAMFFGAETHGTRKFERYARFVVYPEDIAVESYAVRVNNAGPQLNTFVSRARQDKLGIDHNGNRLDGMDCDVTRRASYGKFPSLIPSPPWSSYHYRLSELHILSRAAPIVDDLRFKFDSLVDCHSAGDDLNVEIRAKLMRRRFPGNLNGGLHVAGLAISKISENASSQDQTDGRGTQRKGPSNKPSVGRLFLLAIFCLLGTLLCGLKAGYYLHNERRGDAAIWLDVGVLSGAFAYYTLLLT